MNCKLKKVIFTFLCCGFIFSIQNVYAAKYVSNKDVLVTNNDAKPTATKCTDCTNRHYSTISQTADETQRDKNGRVICLVPSTEELKVGASGTITTINNYDGVTNLRTITGQNIGNFSYDQSYHEDPVSITGDVDKNQAEQYANKCVIMAVNDDSYEYQGCADYNKEAIAKAEGEIPLIDAAMECLATTSKFSTSRPKGCDSSKGCTCHKGHSSSLEITKPSAANNATTYYRYHLGEDLKAVASSLKVEVCYENNDSSDNSCILDKNGNPTNPSKIKTYTFNENGDLSEAIAIPANKKYYIIIKAEDSVHPCFYRSLFSQMKRISGITSDLVKNEHYNDQLCKDARDAISKADGKGKKADKLAAIYNVIVPECSMDLLERYEYEIFDANFQSIKEYIAQVIKLADGQTVTETTTLGSKICEFEAYKEKGSDYNAELDAYLIGTYVEFLKPVSETKYWNAVCTEKLYMKYDYPKLVESGGTRFNYEPELISVKTCEPFQIKKVSLKSLCKYGQKCYGEGHNGIEGAGPNESFDSCIEKCDNGKYTQKCIDKCYKEVYGESTTGKVSVGDWSLDITKKNTAATFVFSPKNKITTTYSNNTLTSSHLAGGKCTLKQIKEGECKIDGQVLSSACVITGNTNVIHCNANAPSNESDPKYGRAIEEWQDCSDKFKDSGDYWGQTYTIGESKACGEVVKKTDKLYTDYTAKGDYSKLDLVSTEHDVLHQFIPLCTVTGEECYEVFDGNGNCSTNPIKDYIAELAVAYDEYKEVLDFMSKESTTENFSIEIDEKYDCDDKGTCKTSTEIFKYILSNDDKKNGINKLTVEKNPLEPETICPASGCKDKVGMGVKTGKSIIDSKKYTISADQKKELEKYDTDAYKGNVNIVVTKRIITLKIGNAYRRLQGNYSSKTDKNLDDYNFAKNENKAVIYNKGDTYADSEDPNRKSAGDYGPFNSYFTALETKVNENTPLYTWPKEALAPYYDVSEWSETREGNTITDTSSSYYTKNIRVGIEKMGFKEQWTGKIIDCFYGTTPRGNLLKPGKILIFRPIDLKNVFPGDETQTGSGDNNGRAPRFNWTGTVDKADLKEGKMTGAALNRDHSYYEYETVDPEYLTQNIQNLEEKIYDNDIEYEFVLNPQVMKDIRKYNAQNGNELDFNNDGTNNSYIDFNMNCTNSYKGKPICLSNVLTDYVIFNKGERSILARCNNGNSTGSGCDVLPLDGAGS